VILLKTEASFIDQFICYTVSNAEIIYHRMDNDNRYEFLVKEMGWSNCGLFYLPGDTEENNETILRVANTLTEI
jgi:hypothetical protein